MEPNDAEIDAYLQQEGISASEQMEGESFIEGLNALPSSGSSLMIGTLQPNR